MQKSNKVGFIVDNLSSSQLSYSIISAINKREKKHDEDFVVFFENSSPVVREPLFSIMGLHELWNFYGVGIATSVSTCFSLAKSPAPVKKFFYVWDLEWHRNTSQYSYIIDAFLNNNIQLIARSEDHAKAITNYCNRDVCGVLDFNFDINNLMEIIK
ncbi:hypothetical protein CL634_06175 [bacterium]|nr:hypothetical protein [bacterium]